MKVLCLTHSSRKFFVADASFNSLEMRFSREDRLSDLPPFEELPPVEEAVPYEGALTVWSIEEFAAGPSLRFLFRYDPGYKVQCAAFCSDRLIVYGSDRLEVLDSTLNVVRTVRHPLLVGGHTVFVDRNGHAVVTSAPANAIFRIDIETGEVIEQIKVPDRYGSGYDLDDRNLHEHYVPTDLQPTHVNCAYPIEDGLLVTLCVPGAVGRFDSNGNYREIVRGFRGCHGAKMYRDLLYLSDSTAGAVVYIDPETGQIRKRLHADTRWLHDAEHVDDETVAVALGDKNEIRLLDSRSGEVKHRVSCDAFGQSVMFASVHEMGPAWQTEHQPEEPEPSQQNPSLAESLGPELLASLANFRAWSKPQDSSSQIGVVLRSESHAPHAYLYIGDETPVTLGAYRLTAEIGCRKGAVMLGLLDVAGDSWLATETFDRENERATMTVTLDDPTTVKPILTATDGRSGKAIAAEIRLLSLRRISEE